MQVRTYFEIKTAEPTGSRYKQVFIQCSKCGGVASATDYYNVGSLIKDQEKEMGKVQTRLTNIESALQTINDNLRVLERLLKGR